ncbi:MAG: hypothetical protein ACREUI_08960 [Burkholderiales bacterium]
MAVFGEVLDYGSDDGSQWGTKASDKLSFYGVIPVVQRAFSSAVHATSALASSTDFGATQLAAVREIQNTLIGLGIWATV